MTISPWLLLLAAVPVLLLGEWMVKRIRVLRTFNIPAPVVGGLVVCLLVLIANLLERSTGASALGLHIQTRVAAPWWSWWVTAEPEWTASTEVDVMLPFLVGFFACLGLNASWALVKKASWQLPLFLSIAALLIIVQDVIGITAAYALGESPVLGLICGSISLTGGHGTALGFSRVLERAGYPAAGVVGVAAATFGLVAAGLLGGPVGGGIIKRRQLKSAESTDDEPADALAPPSNGVSAVDEQASAAGAASSHEVQYGLFGDLRALGNSGRRALFHLVVLLIAIKLGAWVSLGLRRAGLTFPVYIGAMIIGILLRNGLDATRWRLRTRLVDLLGSVCLGIFLSIAMMSLDLIELAGAALPMLFILTLQVICMALFARFVTFNVMGRDYDAAVMAAGHCGFGLGATPAAVANMKALAERYGWAPRAFLVLPLVGAFLIDFVNALVITFFLNFFT